MIRFPFEGKHCYANVYVYDTNPKEYHVHTVNSPMHHNLPESLVLIEQNEKLCLPHPDGASAEFVNMIVEAIEQQLRK